MRDELTPADEEEGHGEVRSATGEVDNSAGSDEDRDNKELVLSGGLYPEVDKPPLAHTATEESEENKGPVDEGTREVGSDDDVDVGMMLVDKEAEPEEEVGVLMIDEELYPEDEKLAVDSTVDVASEEDQGPVDEDAGEEGSDVAELAAVAADDDGREDVSALLEIGSEVADVAKLGGGEEEDATDEALLKRELDASTDEEGAALEEADAEDESTLLDGDADDVADELKKGEGEKAMDDIGLKAELEAGIDDAEELTAACEDNSNNVSVLVTVETLLERELKAAKDEEGRELDIVDADDDHTCAEVTLLDTVEDDNHMDEEATLLEARKADVADELNSGEDESIEVVREAEGELETVTNEAGRELDAVGADDDPADEDTPLLEKLAEVRSALDNSGDEEIKADEEPTELETTLEDVGEEDMKGNEFDADAEAADDANEDEGVEDDGDEGGRELETTTEEEDADGIKLDADEGGGDVNDEDGVDEE